MFNAHNTIKSLFAPTMIVSCANKFANAELYVVEEILGGKHYFVASFYVEPCDYFVVTMQNGEKGLNGTGIIEFKGVLKSQGLLHPDEH